VQKQKQKQKQKQNEAFDVSGKTRLRTSTGMCNAKL
jgi:hypothetical protein